MFLFPMSLPLIPDWGPHSWLSMACFAESAAGWQQFMQGYGLHDYNAKEFDVLILS
jgi:hypothetical protein